MINPSIIIKSKHWPRRLNQIKYIVRKVIKNKRFFKFKKNITYYCNFVLMNDLLIKKYNKFYNKKNQSTDVLTFISNLKKDSVIEKHCDIMISADTVIKDAKKNNKNFYDHITHLIVHSMLHINGYSHNNNKDYIKMKDKEIKILEKLGISNPY